MGLGGNRDVSEASEKRKIYGTCLGNQPKIFGLLDKPLY
jgi:hypothetical protein